MQDRFEGSGLTLAQMGEDALIVRIQEILAEVPVPSGWVGIGDDCAITRVAPGVACVTTTDLLVEDVHFRLSTTDPRSLGWKALAVNVSDVVSMGAVPGWATVSVALPGACPVAWIEDLYRGLADMAASCGIVIVGGDTVGSPGPRMIAITAIGTVAHPLRRDTARPGDRLVLTGWPGLSHAGWWALEHPERVKQVDPVHLALAYRAHRRPEIHQIGAGLLADLGPRVALMDSSDGLLRSAREMAKASKVRIELVHAAIPLHPAVVAIATAAGADPTEWALRGGEDYHLVAAMAATSLELARARGFEAHDVGSVIPGVGVGLDGDTILSGPVHDHFKP